MNDAGFAEEFIKKNQYRYYYRIEYPHDPAFESFYLRCAAIVYIWEDTGKAFDVSFGNGAYLGELDKPLTRGEKEARFMPYVKKPPFNKNDMKRSNPKVWLDSTGFEHIEWQEYTN